MTLRNFLFTALCLSLFTGLSAQNDNDRHYFIAVKAMTGGHLYSGQSLTEEVEWGYGAFDIRFAWQPSKDTDWSRDTGYAAYGVGFYNAFVGDPQVFGDPTALYGFANFYLSKPWRRNVLELSPALGLTYHLKPYDPQTNPTNDAIGSRMAVYFNVHFGGAYKFTRELDLTYGIDFTHYSNGRTWQPNYGLNLFGLNAGIRYNWNAYQREVDRDFYTTNVVSARFNRPERPQTGKFDFKNSIDFYGAAGVVQNEGDTGTNIRYGTISVVADYRRYFNRMHGMTAGLDYFYDASLGSERDGEGNLFGYGTSLLGIHLGYDFMFWRFNIRPQLGGYLSDSQGKGSSFFRVAIQYQVTERFFAQVGLKTKNGFAADWVEFGIGFKPFKW